MDESDIKRKGAKRYQSLRKEKTMRRATKSESEIWANLLGTRKGVWKTYIPGDEKRGRNRYRDIDINPKRSRTESPPPKHKRDKSGINKGNHKCCSFCRPEISNRIYRQSQIRKECKEYERFDV